MDLLCFVSGYCFPNVVVVCVCVLCFVFVSCQCCGQELLVTGSVTNFTLLPIHVYY